MNTFCEHMFVDTLTLRFCPSPANDAMYLMAVNNWTGFGKTKTNHFYDNM